MCGGGPQGAAGLTNVFHVADYAIIDGVAFGIEGTIIMPVHIAVGVEILADNCADNVWTAIDGEIGTRSIKDRSEAGG